MAIAVLCAMPAVAANDTASGNFIVPPAHAPAKFLHGSEGQAGWKRRAAIHKPRPARKRTGPTAGPRPASRKQIARSAPAYAGPRQLSLFDLMFGRRQRPTGDASPASNGEIAAARAIAAEAVANLPPAPVKPIEAYERKILINIDRLTLSLYVEGEKLREFPIASGRDDLRILAGMGSRKSRKQTHETYRVRRGDSLYSIGRKHHLHWATIAAYNNLDHRTHIQVGQRIRIPTKAVRITPIGHFRVMNKAKLNAANGRKYSIPGQSKAPYDLFGTRWIGLNLSGYGIHGTWDLESIGRHRSGGCVRMNNADIEALYEIMEVGDEVVIVRET